MLHPQANLNKQMPIIVGIKNLSNALQHPGGMGKEMGGLRIACKIEKHFFIHLPS